MTVRVVGMAVGIGLLAALAAWAGFIHGCEGPQQHVLAGHVQLAPEVTNQLSPRHVLFVIVRRPQGPPRPIAVKRIDAPRFPVEFEITNADVMTQGSELRGMVEVVARLDADGQAGPPQAGDLEGRFAKNPTLVGARDIDIVINTVY